uniref:photosystem II protein psb28 n=1 Tax=Chlorobotrys sp. TaxID=2859677 RepID=UPI0021821D92|nr:photosystem II protein psb28 [Chlorobotrys sp.]UVI60884.1 photosystem II protein psb28 [Chlorobotrys sp.]
MSINFIIEFESKINQIVLPDKIRITSSKNNHTSTLTLIFYKIDFLRNNTKQNLIKSIHFFQQDYKFSTKDIKFIWIKGRPLFLEAIFLITSEAESVKLKKFFNTLSSKKDKNIFD